MPLISPEIKPSARYIARLKLTNSKKPISKTIKARANYIINMNTSEYLDSQPPFLCHFPAQLTMPLLLSSPHSGHFYPREFTEQSQYDTEILQNFEDPFVDEIYSFADKTGISYINANYARAYVDLNRTPDSFDNLLFKDNLNLNPCLNTKNGYGVIPRLIAADMPIYKEKLHIAEARNRINSVYKPYHEAISNELARIKAKFGKAILIDCHSMPQKALGKDDIDIIIGDCFGASISPLLSDTLVRHFTKQGLKVRKNHIYSGGYITKTYGKPKDNIQAVQIEINRKLYMLPDKYAKSPQFDSVSALIATAIISFMQEI